jgi:hypothetical protein
MHVSLFAVAFLSLSNKATAWHLVVDAHGGLTKQKYEIAKKMYIQMDRRIL